MIVEKAILAESNGLIVADNKASAQNRICMAPSAPDFVVNYKGESRWVYLLA